MSDAGRIVIGSEVRAAMEAHAERIYPEECCGVLFGTFAEDRKIASGAHAIDNARRDSARNRYLMDGEAVRAAAAAAAKAGAEVVGYYHSHPDVAAIPSVTDKNEATWPFYSYVILSVRQGRVAELRSWRLTEDRETMIEEAVLDNEAKESDTPCP